MDQNTEFNSRIYYSTVCTVFGNLGGGLFFFFSPQEGLVTKKTETKFSILSTCTTRPPINYNYFHHYSRALESESELSSSSSGFVRNCMESIQFVPLHMASSAICNILRSKLANSSLRNRHQQRNIMKRILLLGLIACKNIRIFLSSTSSFPHPHL